MGSLLRSKGCWGRPGERFPRAQIIGIVEEWMVAQVDYMLDAEGRDFTVTLLEQLIVSAKRGDMLPLLDKGPEAPETAPE